MKTPLTERVYKGLRRDIITGYFKPGEGLTEQMLAKRYSSSRTPVRQAAARAMQENLLRFLPNKGYFVNQVSIDQLSELFQFRAIIETACAELAAKREHEPEVMARLERVAAVRHERGNRKSYVRFIQADHEFHVGVARLTRNDFMVRAVEETRDSVDRLLYLSLYVGDYAVYLDGHQEIFCAIRQRKPELARERMLEHVLQSKAKLLELI
jgi:DNA-binding GntR family transcriptional regulator